MLVPAVRIEDKNEAAAVVMKEGPVSAGCDFAAAELPTPELPTPLPLAESGR